MKTNVTISELVDELTQFLEVTEERRGAFPDDLPDVFFRELLFLNVFTIDVAIHTAFSHSGQREAVRDAYYASYHAKLLEITKDPSCFGRVANRMECYSEAFRAEDPATKLENVGLAFSRFCGEEYLSTVTLGVTHFGSLFKQAQQFIDSFDISEDWYRKGVALNELGRMEEELSACEKAIKQKPDVAKGRYNKGIALGQLGRPEEELSAYEEACRLKPDYAEAWYNKGVALVELDRIEEALSAFETAIRHKPDYIEAWCNKGVVLVQLGRPEEALSAYEVTIRHKPDHAEAWYNKGNVLGQLGRIEEAISAFETAIRHKPDYAAPWFIKGVLLDHINRTDEAKFALKRARDLGYEPQNRTQRIIFQDM